MKFTTSLIALATSAALAIGLTTACVVDFDHRIEGPYSCDTDDQCISGFICDTQTYATGPGDDDLHAASMTCVRPADLPDEFFPPSNSDRPDTCDRDALGDAYPLDDPLEIQEVCDGQDNNCDGQVDIIFCGPGTMGCPSFQTDMAGNDVAYECNEDLDPPQCEARPFNTLGECNIVLNCIDGQLEETPPDCI